MKTITIKIPTTPEAKKAFNAVKGTARSARGSFASQLQRFAKRIEPKPVKKGGAK